MEKLQPYEIGYIQNYLIDKIVTTKKSIIDKVLEECMLKWRNENETKIRDVVIPFVTNEIDRLITIMLSDEKEKPNCGVSDKQ